MIYQRVYGMPKWHSKYTACCEETSMKSAFVLMILFLSGCAALLRTEPPAGMTQASAEDVAKCKYLGPVSGHTMYLDPFNTPIADAARRDAMISAKDMGATHVVWDKKGPRTTIAGTDVTAAAYTCG